MALKISFFAFALFLSFTLLFSTLVTITCASSYLPEFQPPPTPELNPYPILPPPTPELNPYPILPPPTPELNPYPILPPPTPELNPYPILPPPTPELNPYPILPPPTPELNPYPILPPPTPELNPYPILPPPTPTYVPTSEEKCPRDALKIGLCAKVLNIDLLKVILGKPPVTPCCSLIEGLVDLEVGVCLCTAIKASVLGIDLANIPVSLSLLLNNCGKNVPSGFECA